MLILLYCAAILLPYSVISFPNSDSLVVSDAITIGMEPVLQKMHVSSYIRNRYARTIVHAKYLNPKNEPQEVTFSTALPETAFITEFIMEVKDKQYKAYVREKEAAQREYNKAIESGLGAAHVAASLRDSNEFTISMNVQAFTKVTFNLTYEQLLEMKNGIYEMTINLHPEQLVEDFSVEININETRPIVNVKIPEMQTENEIVEHDIKNKYATISDLNPEGTEKQIIFAPTLDQQKNIVSKTQGIDVNEGISGRFIVQYEVDIDPDDGEVITSDGHFVHFFSSNEQTPLPKNVIFVLDISGSMSGNKIHQLKDAMKVILGETNEEDYFSVVTFHTLVQVLDATGDWKRILVPSESNLPTPLSANINNIFKAQTSISQLEATDLTNIKDALVVALRLANMKNIKKEQNLKPIIIFLTDGEPNVGETNPKNLIDLVKSMDSVQTMILTLAIGNDAKENFLKDLANANFGFMRKIYEASDTSLQLKRFYNEISSPLLSNITFKYDENEVTNITTKYKHHIFKGSDFAIAGKIKSLVKNNFTVEGLTKTGPRTYRLRIKPLEYKKETKKYGSLERLWAYLTIQKLLKEQSSDAKKQALNLALQYSFVTPITSLVVVKPNGTEAIDLKRINVLKDPKLNYHQMVPLKKFTTTTTTTPTPKRNFAPSGGVNFLAESSNMNWLNNMFSRETTTIRYVNPNKLARVLPWIVPYIRDKNSVFLNNTIYFVGDEDTAFDYQPCEIKSQNKSGQCKLLSIHPEIYSKLDSYNTYVNKYMCTLNMGYRIKYLGFCDSVTTK